MAVGAARAPLTCGELVQGTPGGRHFLISCPIDVYSEAHVRLDWSRPADTRAGSCRLLPPLPPGGGAKAKRALQLTMAWSEQKVEVAELRLACPLPAGKGLGTSTADVLAAAQATAVALGRPLSPAELARIALAIEPSDGTMFPGLALFDHRHGLTARILGAPPPLNVITLDLGGQVDTEEFNRRPDLEEANRAKQPQVRRALRLVWHGILRQDPFLLAQGATLSALAHQSILPKPGLEELIERAREMGALGVVNTHSGTVVGVLVPPQDRPAVRLKEYLVRWPGATLLGEARVTGGGVWICSTGAASGQQPAGWV